MAVVIEESSPNRTKVTFVFPTSDATRGSRVVANVAFPTSLAAFSCLLMFRGGRTESSEPI